ncbi:hypothetical protein K402DRAFT_392790 [Aulographum hederae CBS 113979]|uniref:Uncharacterized protein n=1 Tax=Aulographum hederae CBS 113979 TaxID=1176131 RepID=A0A6G1H2T0_9PEZI|nr:hypothetical protein K402DRAFT_392790 [Aulographum hederae CBS 113979]
MRYAADHCILGDLVSAHSFKTPLLGKHFYIPVRHTTNLTDPDQNLSPHRHDTMEAIDSPPLRIAKMPSLSPSSSRSKKTTSSQSSQDSSPKRSRIRRALGIDVDRNHDRRATTAVSYTTAIHNDARQRLIRSHSASTIPPEPALSISASTSSEGEDDHPCTPPPSTGSAPFESDRWAILTPTADDPFPNPSGYEVSRIRSEPRPTKCLPRLSGAANAVRAAHERAAADPDHFAAQIAAYQYYERKARRLSSMEYGGLAPGRNVSYADPKMAGAFPEMSVPVPGVKTLREDELVLAPWKAPGTKKVVRVQSPSSVVTSSRVVKRENIQSTPVARKPVLPSPISISESMTRSTLRRIQAVCGWLLSNPELPVILLKVGTLAFIVVVLYTVLDALMHPLLGLRKFCKLVLWVMGD